MAEILLHHDAAQPRKQRKSATRIHGNGLEAPRNSLDSPLYDHTMTTMRQKSPKGNTPQEKATAKNVIHKDFFPSQPGVIARLMGVDTIPLPAKRDAVMIRAQETSDLKLSSTRTLEMISVTSPRSATFKQSKCSLISYGSSSGDYTYRHCLKKMRQRRGRSRQHHPQEELLEKIREDFQAWQTSKALDSARTVVAASGCPTSSRHGMEEGRYIQMLAQENLHKEKMARYGYGSCRVSMAEKGTLKNVTEDSSDTEITSSKAAAKSNKSGDKVIKVLRVSHCATMPDKFRYLEDEHNNSSTPAKPRSQKRIVLLKPSTSDIVASDQESLFSSSKLKMEGNMEEFLEEVKERLKKELKLKSKIEVVRRSWGTTTDPKQIARGIAKQIRQTVSMQDLGKRLYSRSESFRAFRSDRKRNAAAAAAAAAARNASPEHVRLKSVFSTTSETNDCSPPIIRSRGKIRSLTDMPLSVSASGCDDQSCTAECEVDDADVVSPRALVRSFSAPASGISRGQLFAEEDNVGSGRHGSSDAVSEGAAVAASKNSSFSFSLRGAVSNLRHSLSSRANKLFGKKTHWPKKPSLGEFHPNKMAIGMLAVPPSHPEIFSPLTVAQENFTDLPPSPVSPLEVKVDSSRHFFSDLKCTLPVPELSPKSWSEFEAPRPSNGSSCKKRTNATTEMAYIKQVLVAAGLYDESSSSSSSSPMMNNANANTRVDSMATRPIEVEAAYNTEEDAADHSQRMLFDLANEALEMLVGRMKPGSSLRRWVVDSTGVSLGRKLLDDVWQQVQRLRNPPVQQEMQTVESMVAREAWTSPWIEVLHQDSYVFGRKLERAILDQLIADIVHDLSISQNASD